MDNNIHLRKEYKARLLGGILKFRLVSEYRGNGEYKHMLSLKFLWKEILSLTYRTGETDEGVNVSLGFFKSANDCVEDNGIGHCPIAEYHKMDGLGIRRGKIHAELKK